MHEDGLDDMLIEWPKNAPGMLVVMRLVNDATRTTKEIFDKFAAPEEYTFVKTIVPVRLDNMRVKSLYQDHRPKG
jgi:hypothetical protein